MAAPRSQSSQPTGQRVGSFEAFAREHRHLSPSQRERLFSALPIEQQQSCWNHLQAQLSREREAS